jgi:hypothetical protein
VSFALGAFFAGMMLREAGISHHAVAESLLFVTPLLFVLFKLIEPIRLLILDKWSLARKLEHRADSLDGLLSSTDRGLLAGQVVLALSRT